MKKIIIIGTGISGLSLAYFLEKKYQGKVAITLIEKEKRVGGLIRTVHQEGTLFELGPRGFRSQGKGALTAQLGKELGLTLIHASPSAKERYIVHANNLETINLRYLWKYRCFFPLFFEIFKKKGAVDDESVASFFRRRFSQKSVEHLIFPLCQGIFAQDPEELSMKASFPSLWEKEQAYGSLTRSLFTKREKGPPLTTFQGGMETLPLALARHFKGVLRTNEEVTSIHPHDQGVTIQLSNDRVEADLLILATPHLFNLLPTFRQKSVTLTTVNCAFSQRDLIYKGFGFLSTRSQSLLGIAFDSNIFPSDKSRLCAILKGAYGEEEAKEITFKALHDLLKISTPPEQLLVSIAKDAIYQYPVGHLQRLAELEAQLPPTIILTGSRFYGPSVNDCIARSHRLSNTIFF